MKGDTGTAREVAEKLTGAQIRRRLQKAFSEARRHSATGKIWLDLYAGSYSVGSKLRLAMKTEGLAFDLKDGPHFDLSDETVVQFVLKQVRSRSVSAAWIAFPCSTWSNTRRPLIRSSVYLNGTPEALVQPELRRQLHAGDLTLSAAIRIGNACWRARVPAVLENPQTSLAWQHGKFKWLRQQLDVCEVVTDQCGFGTPWRKRTRLMCVRISTDDARSLVRRCSGRSGRCSFSGKQHVQVVGSTLSRRSAKYSPQFARAAASCLAKAFEKQDLEDCLRWC